MSIQIGASLRQPPKNWTSRDRSNRLDIQLYDKARSRFERIYPSRALQARVAPRQLTRSAAASNIYPDAGVSWAERLLTDCRYGCGDRGYRNSYREGNLRPKARRLNSAGFLRCSNIPLVEQPHHPPSLALRPAGRSALRRLHQRQQFVAVMLELLVADTGDAAKLFKRRRPRRRDAVNR